MQNPGNNRLFGKEKYKMIRVWERETIDCFGHGIKRTIFFIIKVRIMPFSSEQSRMDREEAREAIHLQTTLMNHPPL